MVVAVASGDVMAKISNYRMIMLFLLCASLITICIYINKTMRIESVQGGTSSPYVYQEILTNESDKIVLTLPGYIHRKEYVSEICRANGLKGDATNLYLENKNLLDHILVDEKHQLLYCYVPKVACTNWKRIFMMLTGKANVTNVLDIPASDAHGQGILMSLSNYTADEIEFYINKFTKFVFVRHPFERLLSAYRNKLEQHYLSSQYFQMRFGRHIVKHYRPNPSKDSLIKGDDVTFKEFVAYLTSPENAFNEHWKPIFDLCHLCLIDYDIIGKYETLYEDADFILKQIGQSHIIFPHAKKPSRTKSKAKDYYSTLSQKAISDLYNIYKMDFELFEYTLHDFLSETSTV
ncbi:carbohydrate sulfotransferase 11-like [Ischnura elegans]|uniref:carbohydrate sulfotransferase 11-like n=1 Tax=Ischnura elegans TaxID=197161 RepID=UPI001ED8BC09|nr:carbohydrate sulfotransferase 11-like [Ischnura elegans]